MKSGLLHVENWLACAPHNEMPPNRETEFLVDALPDHNTNTGKKLCQRNGKILFERLWRAKFFTGNGPEFLVGRKFRFHWDHVLELLAT